MIKLLSYKLLVVFVLLNCSTTISLKDKSKPAADAILKVEEDQVLAVEHKASQTQNVAEIEVEERKVLPSNFIDISIVQHDTIVEPINGIVTLDKSAFDIVINLPKPMTVIVNAAYDKALYEEAAEGQFFGILEQFDELNMIAIALHNPYRMLYVSSFYSSPYYYFNEEDYNFNILETEQGRFRCTRTIENISDVDAEMEMPVSEMEAPIYLVFFPMSFEENSFEKFDTPFNNIVIQWKE